MAKQAVQTNQDLVIAIGGDGTINEIIQSLSSLGGDVYGIMHTNFKTTSNALNILFDLWKGHIMAYPESLKYNTKNNTT